MEFVVLLQTRASDGDKTEVERVVCANGPQNRTHVHPFVFCFEALPPFGMVWFWSLSSCTVPPTCPVFVSLLGNLAVDTRLQKEFSPKFCSNCNIDPEVQHDREIKRTALAEYYEKHGGAPHH